MWGWEITSSTIYFNKQNYPDFGNPWLRVGRDNYSAGYTMDPVEGTKYLYSKTIDNWTNMGAFSVADNAGWGDDNNTIYQPYNDNGTVKPDDGYKITNQTEFQKYSVSSTTCYLKLTNTAGSKSNNCQYYQVNNHTTGGNGELVTLPMYSVTYNSSPSHGAVSVQKYTKTDGTTKAPLSTDDEVYPTQIIEITTTPDAHYTLASLTVTGATLIDGTTYYVTGDCEITATFDHQWTILGKDIYEEDAEKDKMGNWNVFNGLPFVSEHTHRGTITLDAHTAYNFKVHDRATTTWYGCGTRDNDYTYVGQTDAVAINSTGNDGHNVMLMTTIAGEYTFEWNDDQKKLMITFPTTIKHPSMDYIYMEKYSDWNGGSYSYIHNWYTSGSDIPLTSGGVDPKMTASFTSKSPAKTFYTYPVLTKYPHFKIAQELNGGDGGVYHATSNMEVTDYHKGHYVYHNGSAWVWATFQVYIKLENQGADEGKKGTLGVPVAFNDTALSTKINKPVKSHYDFGGYYTAAEGGGVQIIDANGDWIANKLDYTSATGAWIHAGDTTTLYAKWTIHPYTITLQVSPTGAGTISPSGTTTGYNSVNSADITATPNAGWKFKEWQFEHVEADYKVWAADTYNSFSNPIQVKVKANATLTAVFEPRYELVGSKDALEDPKGGMPGWSYDGTGAFAVLSSSPSVNLTCTCSLEANTKYKFVIHDRADGKNYGDGKDGQFLLIETNRAHCENLNMNMKFQTTGAAKYIFQINEIDGSGHPYVKLLWPRQVNFGWKYVNADEPNTMKDDGGGGTVTVYAHEAGEKRAIASSGGYIMQGGTISFTAHPYVDYDLAGWWGTYSYDGGRLFETDSIHWPVTSENANAFAKFTEKTNTLTTGTTWNTDGNWSKGHVPTQDEVAVIQSPVEVNSTDAKAKKVLLMQDGGHTGKVEIPAGKELVVRTTIKKTTDGSTYGATGYEDIVIGSSLAAGNGALVMNTNDGTNKATVNFAVKAKKVDGHNVNQFIGTPFNDENNVLYNYYGTKIYRFMAAHNGKFGPDHEWKRVAETNDKMEGFYGYNILTNQTTEPVLWMQGTLNRSAEETINGYYNGSSKTENMFANSWVAPIYIPNFEDDDFVNIEKTIYIFNAGTPEDQGDHAMNEGDANTTAAGQYCVLPANSAPYVGLTVIPSMQAFSVFANGPDPKLKFNYERLVYNPSTNGTATIVPTRAPRRTETEQTAPTVLKLKVSGESGYAANIVMLNRADFSEGFDDGWDGRFLPGDDAAPQLYAVTADGNMAINCSPDIEGTLLGFKAGEADNVFTFTFEYDDEALYLYDTQTQLYTRVQTGNSYTFATEDGDAHNRFILTRKAPSIATGMEASNTPSPGANKVIIDTHLYIFRAGALYDALGRIIQ